eukprot:TRINITY_DN33615_c0_g2_i2.p1 TRINITY_DN33615_c0_g2~~TRINITY_DN33615_c0_g2_i2.p1  ORF type:complete len:249 (+),score=54.05 TRINITY_DN33615_c0_g2_i2:52-798(+)
MMIAMSCILVKIKDNFKMGAEVRALCVWTFVALSNEIFYIFVPLNLEAFWLIYAIIFVVYIWIVAAFPLFLSFRHERETHSPQKEETLPNLDRCLRDFDSREAFWTFLQSEFSVENLAFYETCVEFENYEQNDRTKLLKRAHFILDTFILETAAHSVNISHACRTTLKGKLLTADQNKRISLQTPAEEFRLIFKDAKEEIFALMQNDSFARFSKLSKPLAKISARLSISNSTILSVMSSTRSQVPLLK